MSAMSQKSFDNTIEAQRPKRGRPSGRNRVPLSLEERRARNAQYERERRNETADALTQLAEALGEEPNISNANLLATAIIQIQKSTNEDHSLEDLKRINAKLESQIETLSSRLGLDAASLLLDDDTEDASELRLYGGFDTQNTSCCDYEVTSRQKNKRKLSSQMTSLPKRARISTPQYHLQEQSQLQTQNCLEAQLCRQSNPSNSWYNESSSYYMENMNQSMYTVSSVSPNQEVSGYGVEMGQYQPIASTSTETEYLQSSEDIMPDIASTLNELTESEKELLTNLINENFILNNVC